MALLSVDFCRANPGHTFDVYASNSVNMSLLQDKKGLDILIISQCRILECLKVDWTRYRKELAVPRNGLTSYKYCFHGLHTVEVDKCPMLREMTWLLLVPNLRRLSLINCRSLTQVIQKGVAESWVNVGEMIPTPFPKLERLYLLGVPEMKTIYWNTLPFHCLTQIYVEGCPKLKKLPLHSGCTKEDRVIIYGEEDWWNNLEWEDEATKTTTSIHKCKGSSVLFLSFML